MFKKTNQHSTAHEKGGTHNLCMIDIMLDTILVVANVYDVLLIMVYLWHDVRYVLWAAMDTLIDDSKYKFFRITIENEFPHCKGSKTTIRSLYRLKSQNISTLLFFDMCFHSSLFCLINVWFI